MTLTSSPRIALQGDLLDFTGTPGLSSGPAQPACVRWRPDHWLLIENGRIREVLPPEAAPGNDWQRVDHRGRLILPGFIDTHVHSPQLDVIASYGTALLDWLETYTFPAEQRYADPDVAAAGAARFLDALLAAGTTTAAIFPTVHAVSADALFAAAYARGMRIIAGKVLMNAHAPAALMDDVDAARQDCIALIERWHGQGRLAYAVTPRFALTSTQEQLDMAGALLRDHAGTYMQTHVAENPDEVARAKALFPQARSYLDIYERAGLLAAPAILAHGIWLDALDRQRIAALGAQVAFCPSSNLFLGSGLFDWAAAEAAGVAVSIASDVGGGTSLSMLRTLTDAYKVQAMRGVRLNAWQALHAVTRGAAQALGLDHEIGSLTAGCHADIAVWDWTEGVVARHRHECARTLHERLFAWMVLGSEHNLVETRVAGSVLHTRGS